MRPSTLEYVFPATSKTAESQATKAGYATTKQVVGKGSAMSKVPMVSGIWKLRAISCFRTQQQHLNLQSSTISRTVDTEMANTGIQ